MACPTRARSVDPPQVICRLVASRSDVDDPTARRLSEHEGCGSGERGRVGSKSLIVLETACQLVAQGLGQI